jgi:Phosphotransferase enzyme family
MRRFHIIAVTPDLARTLVIETAAGWLLPWFDDDPRVALPHQIESILRPLVSKADIVHEAPLPDVASAHGVVQGYCAIATVAPALSADATFLENSDLQVRPAVLGFQRKAWLWALHRLRAPTSDFDCWSQVTEALAWVERHVATRVGTRVVSMMRHRCSRNEYVVRLETMGGRMYFKGGSERVADEGGLTVLLHALDPTVVPETVALDVMAGRWIYRELPGTLLSESTLTMSTVTGVVSALARLQKLTVGATSVRDHLASRSVNAVDLFLAADGIVQSTFGKCVNGQQKADERARLIDAWLSSRDALVERCLTVDRLKMPRCLVPSDFWPRNILTTPYGVGFIDLERCYWGYPFLPLWRYLHEVERALQPAERAGGQIESAFVTAWADVVAPQDMTAAFAELPLLGRLFDLLLASRELDSRERDLGSLLSKAFRADLLSRHVRRLLGDLLERP